MKCAGTNPKQVKEKAGGRRLSMCAVNVSSFLACHVCVGCMVVGQEG